MSVKERMTKIQELEHLAAKKAEMEAQLRESEQSEKLVGALPDVRREQSVLLEELRSKGVLRMVEEVTGGKIPPISTEGSESRKSSISQEDFEKIKRALKKGFQEVSQWREWHAWVRDYPAIETGGLWDRTLRIVVWRNNHWEFEHHIEPHLLEYKDRVVIHYSPQRILSIEGGKVTFSGPIPKRRQERKGTLEEAFAQALLAPKRAEARHRHHDHEMVIGAR